MGILIKDKNGVFRMTRLQARKRYLHTIKPIEDLLAYLDQDKGENENEEQRKL